MPLACEACPTGFEANPHPNANEWGQRLLSGQIEFYELISGKEFDELKTGEARDGKKLGWAAHCEWRSAS
jgi:hypothetical protein